MMAPAIVSVQAEFGEPGQQPDQQRDTAQELDQCNHGAGHSGKGHAHLPERSGDADNAEDKELLGAVGDEDRPDDGPEDGEASSLVRGALGVMVPRERCEIRIEQLNVITSNLYVITFNVKPVRTWCWGHRELAVGWRRGALNCGN